MNRPLFTPPFLLKAIAWLGCLCLVFSFNVSAVGATGVYDLAPLGAGSPVHILDTAEAISRANEGRINDDLKKLAQQTGQEVRFVVIRRLDFGTDIDTFAEELFTLWYPTPQEQSQQTLVVLDTLTNSVALRRGAEAQLRLGDEISTSVTETTIAIPLKEGGKYNEALLEADKRLGAILAGQPDPGPPKVAEINLEGTFASAEETDDQSATIWVVVLLALATLIPMATYFWYVGIPGR